jgi:hypothetical protein
MAASVPYTQPFATRYHSAAFNQTMRRYGIRSTKGTIAAVVLLISQGAPAPRVELPSLDRYTYPVCGIDGSSLKIN